MEIKGAGFFDCDEVSRDIFSLRDESLEESANLPAPDFIAAEIVEDLEAALEQVREIASNLKPKESEMQKWYGLLLCNLSWCLRI